MGALTVHRIIGRIGYVSPGVMSKYLATLKVCEKLVEIVTATS